MSIKNGLNLSSDAFTLLNIPKRFELDEALLDKHWKYLLAQTHPDKFSAETQTAQRIATQLSVRINEAYQTLKNPIQRASLLCELAGNPIQSETNTAMPADFLMQQMSWREQLEDANTSGKIEALLKMLRNGQTQSLSILASLIDEKADFTQAAQQVRMLMFMDRFKKDINLKRDELDL